MLNLGEVSEVLVLSLPTATISLTITRSSIFEPFRGKMMQLNKWLGKLVSCPYCLSHWISFAMIGFYRPIIVQSGYYLLDLLVSAFALVGVTMPVAFLMFRSINGMIPETDEKDEEIVELKSALVKARNLLMIRKGS